MYDRTVFKECCYSVSLHIYKFILSLLLGDELYAGVATDLMGRDFTIFRSLGQKPSIRTEQHDSRWLNGMFGFHSSNLGFLTQSDLERNKAPDTIRLVVHGQI